jgi:glucosamine--fructose-6-phosphate aminotransferase (isomerizing)
VSAALGIRLEAEIREQPSVWRRLAETAHARDFANAVSERDVVLVGSGSSLFVAMLGALALRRRGIRAAALAASEANFERGAYCGQTVVALSQSGRSADVLRAVEVLQPERLIALTNDPNAPLADRADTVINVEAGPEQAVPATKSVTAMVAVVLWGAALVGGKTERSATTLRRTAVELETWLDGEGVTQTRLAAERIARRGSVAVVGAGYGVPIALELALKIKEASYLHAEGFAAGEFRHGSAAILDATTTLVGIVDDASREIVRRPLDEAARTESLRYTIGEPIEGVLRLGAETSEAFNTLAWLVAGQLLALEVGRARGIDGDAPRGLTKFVL